MRVLVTSGATREPIDSVRFISNISSGKTGAILAEEFTNFGHEVTYLHGQGAVRPQARVELRSFGSFVSLDAALRIALGESRYHAVVHLAAVSDYSVAEIDSSDGPLPAGQEAKLSSDPETMTLRLKRNPKIVHRLPDYSKTRFFLAAFKLTHGAGQAEREAAVGRLLENPGIHCVAQNDLSEIRGDLHPFTLYSRGEGPIAMDSVATLARNLDERMRRFHAADA